MNKEETAIKIAELIQRKGDFHQSVGKLVLSARDSVLQESSSKRLPSIANELAGLIKDQGEAISPSTLRQYAWVVKSSEELGLPEDIDFSTKRQIISSPHKEKYLKLIEKGYNAAQIKREMAIDNKKSMTNLTGYCKGCNVEVDVKDHNCKETKKT